MLLAIHTLPRPALAEDPDDTFWGSLWQCDSLHLSLTPEGAGVCSPWLRGCCLWLQRTSCLMKQLG